MSRILKLALLAIAVFALAAGGSALATASKGHAKRHHVVHVKHMTSKARTADKIKDQADAQNDVADEHGEATKPADPAEEAQEQADAQKETTDSEQEGDDPAEVAACTAAGVDPKSDNVQYDDETGTCSADTQGDHQDQGDQNDGENNSH